MNLLNKITGRLRLLARYNWSQCNQFTERTHTCGQLTEADTGKVVKLYGWLETARFNNKILIIRDSYGSTQCLVTNLTQDKKQLMKSMIPLESVIEISGLVRNRPVDKCNTKMQTGSIEVEAHHVRVISPAEKNLPLYPKDDNITYENRLRHRYLDLRSTKMQDALRFRSKFCKLIRDSLIDLDFVECETPTLFNRTPGGANEFIVPSQEKSKYYNLVQSPQQLKQLLMIGGLDRYFQICRCYRDEATRPDRQPEFTQVDIELSFTNMNCIMSLIDNILHNVLTSVLPEALDSFDENHRLSRMSYNDAFKYYGTDKPDLRFDWKIEEDESGLHILIPQLVDLDILAACIKDIHTKYAMEGVLDERRDVSTTRISTRDHSELARRALGEFRTLMARQLSKCGQAIYNHRHAFVWVVDFPLFCREVDGSSWRTNHHPFTAPTKETASLLDQDPGKVLGQHYDLVLNGREVGGGSIRIHKADLQKRIFDILQIDESKFDYFIEALKSGCPPHGGIAIGLDRLVAELLHRDSIRETIAFPKSSGGRDLMTNTPHELDEKTRSIYHQSQ